MRKYLERIKQQQTDMGYYKLCRKSKSYKWFYFSMIILSLIVEAVEVLMEVPWKPWVNHKKQNLNISKAAEEISDCIVFCFVLWLTLDPAIDIEEQMNKTMEKIEKRIRRENYGQNHS